MRVIFHPLADAESARTARRFGRESTSKRLRYIAAVETAVRRIEANPGIGSPVFGPYRWVRVGRFKYILYYRQVSADEVRVFAVAHASRRPGYWLRRTRRP